MIGARAWEADRGLAAWLIGVVVLLAVGSLPFFLGGIDPSSLSPPAPPELGALFLISFSPALAAVAVTGWGSGLRGVAVLFSQVGRWRVGAGWYPLALLSPLLLHWLAYGVHMLRGGAPPAHWLLLPGALQLLGLVAFQLIGTVGEELGWRGFAQPRLQRHFTALTASLIVGFIWATWHQWPVLAPGHAGLSVDAILISGYLRLIATAVLYAWLYNSTRGSVLVVMWAHAGHNLANRLVPDPPGNSDVGLTVAMLYAVLAIVVIVATDRRTLTSRSA